MLPHRDAQHNAGQAEPFARLPVRVVDDDRLSALAVRLYSRLLSYRNRKTGRCNPTDARLAAKLGCSRASIIRARAELEAAGWVRVHRRCGRWNLYEFPTCCTGATGSAPETCCTRATGPVAPMQHPPVAPVQQPIIEPEGFEPDGGESEVPARPPKSEAQQKQPALFEAQDRDWFAKAVAYHLGAFPPLAEFAPWYPAVIAAYFARQSWHRQGDPEQAVCTWAMDFHKLGACETEIRAALEWSIETHDKAKHGFGRPDHLRRIKARIVTARQQAATPAARSRGPQDEAAEQAARQSFEEQWAAMAEGERRDIEEHVIAGNPLFRRADLNRQGWTFRSAVKAFLEASTSACAPAEALAAPARPGAAGSAGACTAAGPSSEGSPPAGLREQSGR